MIGRFLTRTRELQAYPALCRVMREMNMNQWNQLTDVFGCKWTEDAIPECAADNICIAWPSIIHCIEKVFDKPSRLKALDFGCGGGLFCRKLHEMGFAVTGYDESEDLVEAARVNIPEGVTVTNSATLAAQRGRYDLITSIMVLQFVEDIDPAVEKIISLLKPDGLLVHAVFNPEFIEENSGNPVFTGFEDGRAGYMELRKGVRIPVCNRTGSEYRDIFERFGCKEIYRDLPHFTAEFLGKYTMPFSTEKPEYLIQAFRREGR